MSRLHGRPARFVAYWGMGITAATLMLVGYGGRSLTERWALFVSGIAFIAVTALLVLVLPSRPDGAPSPAAGSGAPAVALAAAMLVGGLAWIYGLYIAYLAAPLVLYAVFKIRADTHHPRKDVK